jgi:GT2 family glycosyltransferase
MFVFGSPVTSHGIYSRCAEPGIRLAAEPDSVVIPQLSAGSIFRNYNLLLDRVQELDDVEALVLLHQDAEIVDPNFCDKARDGLADPDVALVGCVGAVGVRSIAWWEGSWTWGSFVHRYSEFGGGDLAGMTWDDTNIPPTARLGEVDSIDGFVIVMSPWAIRELRFDESLGSLHGYDLDICLQARAAGKKVVTRNFKVIHHHSLDLIGQADRWMNAHMAVAEKWGEMLDDESLRRMSWKQRARQAEAAAAASRSMATISAHLRRAQAERHAAELEAITSSPSWRLTAPLRWLKRLVARPRGDRASGGGAGGSPLALRARSGEGLGGEQGTDHHARNGDRGDDHVGRALLGDQRHAGGDQDHGEGVTEELLRRLDREIRSEDHPWDRAHEDRPGEHEVDVPTDPVRGAGRPEQHRRVEDVGTDDSLRG